MTRRFRSMQPITVYEESPSAHTRTSVPICSPLSSMRLNHRNRSSAYQSVRNRAAANRGGSLLNCGWVQRQAAPAVRLSNSMLPVETEGCTALVLQRIKLRNSRVQLVSLTLRTFGTLSNHRVQIDGGRAFSCSFDPFSRSRYLISITSLPLSP
jgi:hypothetical protein